MGVPRRDLIWFALVGAAVSAVVAGAGERGAPAAKPHISAPPVADGGFPFWLDPPGSAPYKARNPKWYDKIQTAAGQSFTNAAGDQVNVAWSDKGAIHLYADPAFLAKYDARVRDFNGAMAADWTGVVDRCGWPNTTAAAAPKSAQYQRQTTPLHETFDKGLDPSTVVIARVKGCCDVDKFAPNPYAKNINVATDVVNGVKKNVLAMTAWNQDDPNLCPGPKCRKIVASSGSIATAGLFGSGRYEVIAKVPAVEGLVFAVWTFHYEEHLPQDCTDYTCWCSTMPDHATMVADKCEFRFDGSGQPCKYATVCDDNTDGWHPTPPPPPPILSPYACGQMHAASDPQFLENDTFGGWATTVNHEIDIEIPANCANTANVCDQPGSVNGSFTCTGLYNTLNMNNYIYSQNSGTGPAYMNACAKVFKADGKTPFNLYGDGQYHNYTIVWHTTGKNPGEGGYVETYVDGHYLGTNNAFAPTRGSRFTIAHWGPLDKNALWNGRPDAWDGGKPGDGQSYNVTTMISEINVTPFNEPGDLMYPATNDLPDGCEPNYHTKWPSSPDVCHPVWTPVSIAPPAADGARR